MLLSLPAFWQKCKSSDLPIRAFETLIGDSDFSEISYRIFIVRYTFLTAFLKNIIMKTQEMKIINPYVAGIDVGSKSHFRSRSKFKLG